MPDQEGNQGKACDFSRMIPQESGQFGIVGLGFGQMMNQLASQPYRGNFRTYPCDQIAQNHVDDKGYQTFPRLGQGNERPRLHAPDVGGHEQDDDHPFPPAEYPVNVIGSSYNFV